MKKTLMMVSLFLLLAACTPSETVIQTAVAQTQAAAPTAIPSIAAPAQSDEGRIQTAIVQTQAAAAKLTADTSMRIQAAVVQTLTALAPTQTPIPLISPTPVTPTATITSTKPPWPTITNTTEPFVPSGPIVLLSVQDAGGHRATLTWQADGSFLNGLNVLWSNQHSSPAYPDDYWMHFVNGHTRSATIDVQQANTYYFRVCEFAMDGKSCVNYSNVVQFTIQ